MLGVVSALLPVFVVIGLGYGLRRAGFVPDGFWPPAEKLTYYLLFPSLLVANLAKADLSELSVVPVAAALLVPILTVSGLLVAARARLALEGPAFTSVVQGAIRPNTYVGLAAAAALYGSAGLTLTAVGIAVVVPLVNVVSVVVLSRYGAGDGDGSVGSIAATIVRNPLILACLAGIALNWSGEGLPFGVGEVLEILGRAALAIGLLAVGAGLDPAAVRASRAAVLVAGLCKLLLLPGLTWAVCAGLGVGGITAAVAVLFNALPAASSAYVLARQLGGDHGLRSGIFTAQTALAALTLPVVAVLAR